MRSPGVRFTWRRAMAIVALTAFAWWIIVGIVGENQAKAEASGAEVLSHNSQWLLCRPIEKRAGRSLRGPCQAVRCLRNNGSVGYRG